MTDASTQPPAAAPAPPSGSRGGRLLSLVVIACTAAAFEPVLRLIVTETVAREQIRQSAILLGAAIGLVVWQHRRELHAVLDPDNRSIAFLLAAYACLGGAWLTGIGLLVLPGFGFALAGSLRLAVGEKSARFFRPIVAGLVLFLVMIIAFPLLDLPLRGLAGIGSANLLQTFGLTPQLALVTEPEVKLFLRVGERIFHVATECNGFGLITSSALTALLLGGISGRRGWAIALWMIAGVVLGFLLNVLRILSITLLAPRFPDHYHAMHEVMGTLALWIGLGLVAWGAWRRDPATDRIAPAAETPPPAPNVSASGS